MLCAVHQWHPLPTASCQLSIILIISFILFLFLSCNYLIRFLDNSIYQPFYSDIMVVYIMQPWGFNYSKSRKIVQNVRQENCIENDPQENKNIAHKQDSQTQNPQAHNLAPERNNSIMKWGKFETIFSPKLKSSSPAVKLFWAITHLLKGDLLLPIYILAPTSSSHLHSWALINNIGLPSFPGLLITVGSVLI